MNKNITTETFNKIKKQFNLLAKFVDERIQKTDSGWILPETTLAIAPDVGTLLTTYNPESKIGVITIKKLNYKGDDSEEFDKECSRQLFCALANYFTPRGVVFEIYKNNCVDDGEFTKDCIQFKGKIGDAIEYAQSLIIKYFRDKTKTMKFPDLYYKVPTSCIDSGAYADSVNIVCHKTCD